MSDLVGMKRSSAIFVAFGLSFVPMAFAQPATQAADTVAAPVERAATDAVARLYAQLAAERVEGLSISEIVDRVGGREILMNGLARARQIGGPRQLADGVVQVSLEIEGPEAAELVVAAVNAAPEKSSIAPHRLKALLRPWAERSFRSTGDSVGAAARRDASPDGVSAAQTQTADLTLPEAPPAWAQDAHTASGTATAAGSQLRTARAAEKSARAALREQVAALKLDEQTALSAAGSQAREAVDLAVSAAKISGVDYRADGSVEVRVTIDGQQLWQMLLMTSRSR